MENKKYETITKAFEAKFEKDFYIDYPFEEVIQFDRHVLAHQLGIKSGMIFDYGCGTGAHLRYFARKGFIPYGCEINRLALEYCKQSMPDYAQNFLLVPPVPMLEEVFPKGFDVVISNRALSHLSDEDMPKVVRQIHVLLKEGGIFFATMRATTDYYHRFVTEGATDGLCKVELKGPFTDTTFINFKTRDQVLDLFTSLGFAKLHFGLCRMEIREDEGSTDHFVFVGTKRNC